MSPQYGELRSTSGWDRLTSLGHPCKFQLILRLGSVTAWHLLVGVSQTLRHWTEGATYSAGRPSRWLLAHISSFGYFCVWNSDSPSFSVCLLFILCLCICASVRFLKKTSCLQILLKFNKKFYLQMRSSGLDFVVVYNVVVMHSIFWATICKTFALCYRTVVLSVCLSVCPVCLWRCCIVAKWLDGLKWNLACG